MRHDKKTTFLFAFQQDFSGASWGKIEVITRHISRIGSLSSLMFPTWRQPLLLEGFYGAVAGYAGLLTLH
jgi:hypothetical protein